MKKKKEFGRKNILTCINQLELCLNNIQNKSVSQISNHNLTFSEINPYNFHVRDSSNNPHPNNIKKKAKFPRIRELQSSFQNNDSNILPILFLTSNPKTIAHNQLNKYYLSTFSIQQLNITSSFFPKVLSHLFAFFVFLWDSFSSVQTT